MCKIKSGSLKSKLAVKADNFWTKCWVCGYKRLSVYYLIKSYHPDFLREFVQDFCDGILPSENEEEDVIFSETPPVELPMGFVLLAEQFDNPRSIIAGQVKTYLLNRGATLRDFWYFKYGVTIHDKSLKFKVVIPSFDEDGKLNHYTSRTIIKYSKGPKYYDSNFSKENIIFNEINIDWKKELTIVEGPFDLLKCNDNATCLLGSTMEQSWRLFQTIVRHETPVLLALDNDAKKKQLKLAKMLAEFEVPVRLYSVPKHLNDVGEMTKKEFVSGIKNSVEYRLEDDFQHQMGVFQF